LARPHPFVVRDIGVGNPGSGAGVPS
jgi:hypothetical protein